MLCTNPQCGRDTKVLRKGLCNTCSQRMRRNGTLGYRDPESMIGRASRGDAPRNVEHPMYRTWQSFVSRHRGEFDSRWNSLKTYAEDVGPKPSDRHFMAKLREEEPWGPTNFYWRQPMFEKRSFKTTKDLQEYNKEYKRYRKGYDRENRYKRKYGITMAQYEEMLKGQEGMCAICGNHESQAQQGTTRQLAVDHDHKTGKVRELLDNKCNAILGHADDSIELLEAAIEYLRKHS